MRELQFKTGGRRLRIEDLEALQDGIKGASAFLGASGRNYVVTGCEITVNQAVANQSSSSLPDSGSKIWDSIQLDITSGYVWMDGKLRKVEGKTVTISNINENVYIVTKDTLSGNNIVYFDGTIGQQFEDYGAEIIVTTNVPDSAYLAVLPSVDVTNDTNPTKLGYKFLNFNDSFLSIFAVPRSGCQLDNKARLSFISTVNEQDYTAALDGSKIKFTLDRHNAYPISTLVEAGGITLYDDDGSTPVIINISGISAPKVCTDKLYTSSGKIINVSDLYKVLNNLSDNNIQIDSNIIRLTYGVDEDGDERYTEIIPSKIVVHGDDFSTTISEDTVETTHLKISNIYAGLDEKGYERWIGVNKLLTTAGGTLDNGASLTIYNSNKDHKLSLSPEFFRMSTENSEGTTDITEICSNFISSTHIEAHENFIVYDHIDESIKPGITTDVSIGDKILRIVGGIIVGYNTP